ncbi:MAG TPA: nodulation protein NfeD [Geobacteraceae bacterium]|nr:nodulation protein NfeD [Geobacteraceae bacterium]
MPRLFFLILPVLVLLAAPVYSAAAPQVAVVAVNGPINPVTAEYLRRNLRESALRGDRLLLVEMDTPGGLDSAMREIVKDIFASPVPVAVHVAPSGARAASAGAVIALAADICAMAPGTNIGAAHPVAIGEAPDKVMEKKMVNDAEAYIEGIALKRGRNAEMARRMVTESISLSADKALAENVVDLIATDRQDLLRKLDGRRLVRDGKETYLRLAGVEVKPHEMGAREKILDIISNPNVAYVLMMLGFLGLFFELSNPGVILPGVIGGISLILAFFAFQTLPVNYAGVLLILLAIILFIAEIKIVSHGMLTVGGVIAMVLGSLLLFQSPEPYLHLSWGVISVTVVMTTLFFVVAVAKAVRAHRKKPVTGGEGLVGEEGAADTEILADGKVFVRGEYWDAASPEPIRKGEKIIVVAVEGMRLKVRKIS